VPNTEFEGGEDGHGYSDCTFLVKQAQPSHIGDALLPRSLGLNNPFSHDGRAFFSSSRSPMAHADRMHKPLYFSDK
jgi:hypothetical protein